MSYMFCELSVEPASVPHYHVLHVLAKLKVRLHIIVLYRIHIVVTVLGNYG